MLDKISILGAGGLKLLESWILTSQLQWIFLFNEGWQLLNLNLIDFIKRGYVENEKICIELGEPDGSIVCY